MDWAFVFSVLDRKAESKEREEEKVREGEAD